jgi:predicted glycosyltransferase
MKAEEFADLYAMRADGLGVERFTPWLVDYLAVADLSISLAGYNSCMNLLATGVPALVWPYSRQREQPLRVERLKPFLPIEVLSAEDLKPGRLELAIETGLALARRPAPVALRLDGAATTARILAEFSP